MSDADWSEAIIGATKRKAEIEKEIADKEECRRIWRDIVLHFVKYPNISQIGGNWLLSFAKTCPSDGLPRANIQYVALNLLLFHYESTIFTERMDLDVFQMLDEIVCFRSIW